MRDRPNKTRDPIERFWERVDKNGPIPSDPGPTYTVDLGGCWLWLGAPGQGGYGTFSTGSRNRGTLIRTQPHRFAYELLIGPIPEGLEPDHLCRVRHCVNPAHLEPVTRSVNLRRGRTGGRRPGGAPDWQRAKTHCPQGHEYTPENTYVLPSRPTARYCRECHRLHTRARRAKS